MGNVPIYSNDAEQATDASTPMPALIEQLIGTGSPGKMKPRVNSVLHPVPITVQFPLNLGLPKLTL